MTLKECSELLCSEWQPPTSVTLAQVSRYCLVSPQSGTGHKQVALSPEHWPQACTCDPIPGAGGLLVDTGGRCHSDGEVEGADGL